MNKTSQYDFTIVVPVYNEADNMSRLERELGAFLPRCTKKACVLFVNDGSTDASYSCISKICERNAHFFFLNFEKNAGLSAAIKAGIDVTESPYVGYIDADLQTNPEDFNLLLPHTGRYALVTGIRVARKDSVFKKMQSKIANGFRRMMTGDGIQDTGCPLKVLRTDVAKRVPFFNGMHRFLPALVLLQKEEVMQIPVRHAPRTAGKSKYHLWNRLIAPTADCFVYRWMKKRYILYRIENDNL